MGSDAQKGRPSHYEPGKAQGRWHFRASCFVPSPNWGTHLKWVLPLLLSPSRGSPGTHQLPKLLSGPLPVGPYRKRATRVAGSPSLTAPAAQKIWKKRGQAALPLPPGGLLPSKALFGADSDAPCREVRLLEARNAKGRPIMKGLCNDPMGAITQGRPHCLEEWLLAK